MPLVLFLCPDNATYKSVNHQNVDNTMNIIKKTITGLLLLFALLPLAAQERTDTVYTFRFVTGNDMFYVPWNATTRN